jgi:mRNA interferase HigB
MGTAYIMHVISRKTLIDFYTIKDFKDSKGQIESWYYEAKNADWASPAEVKEKYRSASILKNNRIVFNIAGNKYRLVVRVNFESKTIFIRFIGTHKEYDKIDAGNI